MTMRRQCVNNEACSTFYALRFTFERVKPDLYELFSLHAAARGTPAPRGAAKMVFAPDGTVTPFDIGVILAEYL